MSSSEAVPSRLRTLLAASPSATFCTFLSAGGVAEISMRDLYARSMAYAACYVRSGAQPGDLIIVMLEHSPHLFYSYVGAILMGAVPSFMPFPSPKQRPEIFWSDHEELFRRIKPRLFVTYAKNLDAARAAIPGFSVPTLIADDSILETPASSLPDYDPSPDDVACLQHSSGTTSLKKGVMLTHRTIIDQIDTYARTLQFGPDDSIASWLPLYHDMGFIACFMMSLLRGTRLVMLDPFEWVMRPQLLLDAIERYRTSFCWLPNFAFAHLANSVKPQARWDLSSMRAFINCSEPCKPRTFERFLARFGSCGATREKLQVCYAMAENVFAVTQTPLGEVVKTHDSYLSCGAPLDGVRARFSEEGEIAIAGRFLFDGYYLQPEKTAERVRDGWYFTGDMGFMHDGELYVAGRIDDMIIVNGRNFYAHEIESIVSELPSVIPGRSVAVGVDDPLSEGSAIVVLAEHVQGANTDRIAREIREVVFDKLGVALADVMPVAAGSLVKTTSGKLSRSKNKELYDNRRA